MATHASTRSTTRAKILTAITVTAAGLAAYAAGSLSTDLLQGPASPGTITRADQRRSCILSCEYNGGFPCGASLDAASEQACANAVRSCQTSCPLPDQNTVLLRGDAAVQVLPNGQLGMPYHRVLVALPIETLEGGLWEITKGALPAGLALDPASGTLSGTPSVADTYHFSVTRSVLDEKNAAPIRVTAMVRLTVENQQVPVSAAGSSASAAATSAITPIDITTPIGQVFLTRGEALDIQLQVYGISTAEQQWSIAYGRLPEGMTLTPSGRLHGRSTEKAGSYRFGVTVTSPRHAASGIREYTDGMIELTDPGAAAAPAPTAAGSSAPNTVALQNDADAELEANTAMFPATLPVARVGEAYSVPFSLNDGFARIWSASGLPQGLSFNPQTRVLSGTPTQDGMYSIRVNAPRAVGGSYGKTYNLTVNRQGFALTDAEMAAAQIGTQAAPGIVIDISVPEGVAGRPYSAQLRAMSSYATHRWSFGSTSAIPAGWTLSSSGVLAHPNPRVGIVTLPIIARGGDSAATAQEHITLNVRPLTVAESATTPTAADTAAAGTAGTVATNPPAGTVATTPPAGTAATASPAGTVAAPALAFANVSGYPDGTIGVAYSARPFEVTGGSGTYTYSRSSGALPPGLTLSANGTVQGTPTAIGTHNFTMRVVDAAGTAIQASRTIRIVAAPAASCGSGKTFSGGGGGGGGGAIGAITVNNSSESAATQARLNTLNRLGIRVHDLIKLQDDGDANTQHDTTVYYIGSDGRRHFFPNPHVYFTWFHDFNAVRIVSAASLAEIPLGANVTYRPGVRMVKFESDNKVYVVEGGRRLRWIQSESDASSIYGANWNRNIDDIPVVFYTDYVFGATLGSAGSFSPAITMAMITWPSQVLP